MNELFNDLFVPAVAVSGILALANIAMFVTIVAKNRGFTILALERLLSFLILIAGATVSFVTRNAVFSVIAPACSCLFVFFDIAVKPGRKEEEKKEEEVAPDTGVSEYEQQISRIFDLLKDLMTRVQECFTLTDGINVVKFLDLFISTVSNEIEADGGVVFLIDDYEDMITAKSYFGHFPPPYELPSDVPHKQNRVDTNFKYIQFSLGETVFGEVATTGQPVFIPDGVGNEKIFQNGPEEFLLPGSYIFVPLIVNDRIIGVAGFARLNGKPFFTEEDFDLATLVSKFAGISINNLNSFQELLDHSDIEQEMIIASDIQKKLLPKKLLDLPGAEFGAFFTPAKGICGDYHDVITARRDRIGIAIGDIAGKGTVSTMIMIMIRSILHLVTNTTKDAGTILTWVNRGITGRIDVDHYASLTYVNYNMETNEIEYASAGHPPMLIWRAEEKKIELVKTKTDPIGVERSTEYETLHLTVKPGDVIILYTDGVLEALNSEGKQYGLERLSDFISRNSGASAKDLSNKIKADIREFCGSERQHDDQTILLMKINNTKKEL